MNSDAFFLWKDAVDEHSDELHHDRTAISLCLSTPTASLSGEILVRSGFASLMDMVPMARRLADRTVDSLLEHFRAQGLKISCRASCASCCKQYLIPVSPPEAGKLWDLVESLPPDDREKYYLRFLAAMQRITQASPFTPPRSPDPQQRLEALSAWYADLNQPCPFLDAALCSIYPDRPLACREYLVFSPPEQCAGHHPGQGEKVPLPFSIAEAIFQLAAELDNTDLESIILTLLPMWVEGNLARLRRNYPAVYMAERFAAILHKQALSQHPARQAA